MRLLNTETLLFEEFFESKIPEYAILSHTWATDEVTFEQYLDPETRKKQGFEKIKQTCKEAQKQGLLYAWVDTCCIHKTSSAELTEAINSMFKWYENSTVCFAYLSDVSAEDSQEPDSTFTKSRWFKRGWTLQELLAPRSLEFFAADWTPLGGRAMLAGEITMATGIDELYLSDQYEDGITCKSRSRLLARASVAERMSWAALRETSRVEDTAYSLLGLFNVNMPLLYGEGAHAFLRLQEEILRRSLDPTLLAWNLTGEDGEPIPLEQVKDPTSWQLAWRAVRSQEHPWTTAPFSSAQAQKQPTQLLAPSPRCFKGCQDIITHKTSLDWTLTSKGLIVSLPKSDNGYSYVVLPCRSKQDPWRLIAIPIQKQGTGAYSRVFGPARLVRHSVWWQWSVESIVLATTTNSDDSNLLDSSHALLIRHLPEQFQVAQCYSTFGWTAFYESGRNNKHVHPLYRPTPRDQKKVKGHWDAILVLENKTSHESFAITLQTGLLELSLRMLVQKLFSGDSDYQVLTCNIIRTSTPAKLTDIIRQIGQEEVKSPYLDLPNGKLHVQVHHGRLVDGVVYTVDIYHTSEHSISQWLPSVSAMDILFNRILAIGDGLGGLCKKFYFIGVAIVTVFLLLAMFASTVYGFAKLVYLIAEWSALTLGEAFPAWAELGLSFMQVATYKYRFAKVCTRFAYHILPVISCFAPETTPWMKRYRSVISVCFCALVCFLDPYCLNVADIQRRYSIQSFVVWYIMGYFARAVQKGGTHLRSQSAMSLFLADAVLGIGIKALQSSKNSKILRI